MTELSPPALIDIGANLTHESFQADLDQVLARAAAVGVTRMIVTGADHAGIVAAAELARGHPGRLWSTAGIHPHHAKDCHDETLSLIRQYARLPQVVAVGETGLDFFRDFSPRRQQELWFARQLEVAVELQKPVFLHERDAHEHFAGILSDYLPRLPRAVVHCFTGDGVALTRYLDMGCYIGITGWICDERRGQHLLELMAQIPTDRLMLETDAPYLLPRNLKPAPKSRRNEPAYLPHILHSVAAARAEAAASLAAATTATAEYFFDLN